MTDDAGVGGQGPPRPPARRRSPSTLDLVLGGVLTVLMLGEFAAGCCGPDITAPAIIVALLVAMGAAVATRTMAPFASFLVNAAGVIAVIALGFDGLNYQWTNLLCLYTVAERSRSSLSYIALIIGELGVTAWFLLAPEPQPPAIQVFIMLAWLVGWSAGMQVATRRGEIAAALVVSSETVKTHLKRMYAKLGVRDRAQAVVVAYESGAVRPGT